MSQRGLQLTHSGSVSLQRGARATTTCLHLVSKYVCTRYNPGIFANYTALPFLAKLPRREQGTKCPQMIQPCRCLPTFTSRSPLPKGLVKAGKLPSTFTWACRYPKLPSTAVNCFSSQREGKKIVIKSGFGTAAGLQSQGQTVAQAALFRGGTLLPPPLFIQGKLIPCLTFGMGGLFLRATRPPCQEMVVLEHSMAPSQPCIPTRLRTSRRGCPEHPPRMPQAVHSRPCSCSQKSCQKASARGDPLLSAFIPGERGAAGREACQVGPGAVPGLSQQITRAV